MLATQFFEVLNLTSLWKSWTSGWILKTFITLDLAIACFRICYRTNLLSNLPWECDFIERHFLVETLCIKQWHYLEVYMSPALSSGYQCTTILLKFPFSFLTVNNHGNSKDDRTLFNILLHSDKIVKVATEFRLQNILGSWCQMGVTICVLSKFLFRKTRNPINACLQIPGNDDRLDCKYFVSEFQKLTSFLFRVDWQIFRLNLSDKVGPDITGTQHYGKVLDEPEVGYFFAFGV